MFNKGTKIRYEKHEPCWVHVRLETGLCMLSKTHKKTNRCYLSKFMYTLSVQWS